MVQYKIFLVEWARLNLFIKTPNPATHVLIFNFNTTMPIVFDETSRSGSFT